MKVVTTWLFFSSTKAERISFRSYRSKNILWMRLNCYSITRSWSSTAVLRRHDRDVMVIASRSRLCSQNYNVNCYGTQFCNMIVLARSYFPSAKLEMKSALVPSPSCNWRKDQSNRDVLYLHCGNEKLWGKGCRRQWWQGRRGGG